MSQTSIWAHSQTSRIRYRDTERTVAEVLSEHMQATHSSEIARRQIEQLVRDGVYEVIWA